MFSEAVGNSHRRELYESVKKEFNKTSIFRYDKFYNHYGFEIWKSGTNPFTRYEKLEPLCEYVECFTEVSKGTKDNYTHRISFGIKQSNVENYFRKKAEAEEQGIAFISPDFKKAGAPSSGNVFTQGKENWLDPMYVDSKVEQNAISCRFRHWYNLMGINRQEACMMAMDSVVKLHPHEDIMDLVEYQTGTKFDRYTLQKKYKEPSVTKNVYLKSDILEQTERIVARYNSDVDNIMKVKWNVSSYINDAMALLNSKVPLKYSNPELLREVETLESVTALDRKNKSAKKG